MENQHSIAKIVLWFARIIDALILSFILFFVIAHIFGENESSNGFQSIYEMITFIFFPIFTILGLALAWRWELLGGLTLTGSILGLFILRPDLILNPYMLMAFVPGVLFIAYWRLSRRQQTSMEE